MDTDIQELLLSLDPEDQVNTIRDLYGDADRLSLIRSDNVPDEILISVYKSIDDKKAFIKECPVELKKQILAVSASKRKVMYDF